MENPQGCTDNGQKISFGHFYSRYEIFGRDGRNRRAILCLGLMSVTLLIVAVVLGIKCAKVKDSSLQVPHSAAAQLITELNYLRSNHSDVIEAEEEATKALERALKNHVQLKKFVSNSIENKKTSTNFWQNGFWIGVTDIETEGTWVWINNVTEVEQRYWMDGEPNNLGHHGEHCGVAVYSSFNPWKTWFDANCNTDKQSWMCEMPSR
ncbi:CD209 antigen-like protein B [Lates japonicus]|uniref:CD209 antigen-like protein B n=1 Tax=Lates japonicus TaxID=270547 RepID=A0AAD3RBQ8_LATJO|nr:CD209 antigen-like protein B [Lates japonicus]